MYGTLKAALAAGTLTVLGAMSAHAATTNIDFTFNDAQGASVAYGTFAYDSALSGILGYSDLSQFFFAIGSTVHDLSWVGQSTGSDDIFGFAYDTQTVSFVSQSQTVSGASYPFVFAALKSVPTAQYGYEGFFVRPPENIPALMSYPDAFLTYSTLKVEVRPNMFGSSGGQSPGGPVPDLALISTVPLPASAWLMGAALVALGSARRFAKA